MLKIFPLPALIDNYIWLISKKNSPHYVVVDPGEAGVVLDTLQAKQGNLLAILITHHHWDHTNGLKTLVKAYPDVLVFGSSRTKKTIPLINHIVDDGAYVKLSQLDIQFQVILTPGHTLDHVCYYTPGCLLCGDTLFTGGCGRLLEGTAKQMLHSLDKLMELPDSTQVYCAHEYTEKNLKFAHKIEANNQALNRRIQDIAEKRQRSEPTVPETLAVEKATNPFLRCDQLEIADQLKHTTPGLQPSRLEIFTALRHQKDCF